MFKYIVHIAIVYRVRIAAPVFILLFHNLTSTAIIHLNITFMQSSVILCRLYNSLFVRPRQIRCYWVEYVWPAVNKYKKCNRTGSFGL